MLLKKNGLNLARPIIRSRAAKNQSVPWRSGRLPEITSPVEERHQVRPLAQDIGFSKSLVGPWVLRQG